ncbi:hypothetical protein [Caballeronia glebae]|uniref:hypothetical protein n=1 Tax=Caballeronia glebae TaxID=1777143 RepID=UPI0038BAE867
MSGLDFGVYIAMREDLGRQYMQRLRAAPRGDVMAWLAAGCIAAADAFAIGAAEWTDSSYGAKAYGMSSTAGNGHAYSRDVTYHHRASPYL